MCKCTPEIRTPFCGKGSCQWPEKKVSNIEDVKPHLTINCGDKVHVVPVSLIEDVIEGRKDLTQIDDWENLARKILQEWLDLVS